MHAEEDDLKLSHSPSNDINANRNAIWRFILIIASALISWTAPGVLQLFQKQYWYAAVFLIGFYGIPILLITIFSAESWSVIAAIAIKYLILVIAALFSMAYAIKWSAPRNAVLKTLVAAFLVSLIVWFMALESVWLFKKSGTGMAPEIDAGDFVVVKSIQFSVREISVGDLILFERPEGYLDIRKVVEVRRQCSDGSTCYAVSDGKNRIEAVPVNESSVTGLVMRAPLSFNQVH